MGFNVSEIFGRLDSKGTSHFVEADGVASLTTSEALTRGSVEMCKSIKCFEEDDEGVNLALVEIFPDSKSCILEDRLNYIFYVANIDMETISWIGMTSYEIILICDKGILVRYTDPNGGVSLILTNGHITHYIASEMYEPVDESLSKGNLTTTSGEKIEVDLESTEEVTESEEEDIFDDLPCSTHVYGREKFVVSERFIHYTDGTNKVTLAVKGFGSLFGYSMYVDEEGSVELGREQYSLGRRLGIVGLTLTHNSTEQEYILGIRSNKLKLLESLTDVSSDIIPMANGVPILLKTLTNGRLLSVFTPNLQQVVLASNNRNTFNIEDFGNGVFITKEGVLILDIGALAFCTKKAKLSSTYLIRGKEYKVPVKHMGELDGISNQSSEEETKKTGLPTYSSGYGEASSRYTTLEK